VKPVTQTKFGSPGGNCHAAALASILELPLSKIPSFGSDNDWYDRFSEYMVSNYSLQPFDIIVDTILLYLFVPRGYHLINGTSPRGLLHTVVGFAGEMVHDPHPDGSGLSEIDSYTIFSSLYILPNEELVRLNQFLDQFGDAARGSTLVERVEMVIRHYATQMGRWNRRHLGMRRGIGSRE
jgi:hypothetical protein